MDKNILLSILPVFIKKNRPHLGLYAISLAVVWTISIFAGLFWNIAHEKDNTLEVAKIQARIAYEKDVIYRRWKTLPTPGRPKRLGVLKNEEMRSVHCKQ